MKKTITIAKTLELNVGDTVVTNQGISTTIIGLTRHTIICLVASAWVPMIFNMDGTAQDIVDGDTQPRQHHMCIAWQATYKLQQEG